MIMPTTKKTTKSNAPKKLGAYKAIIQDIFGKHFNGDPEFEFGRDEIADSAEQLGLKRPKNLGDVIYTFRYRTLLPKSILDTQPAGMYWLILGAGDARYRFRLSKIAYVRPTSGLLIRKVPDATPEIIAQYALTDEQALLAKIRYNRLVDAFLGIVSYSLQNHLRTKISNYGQIEIDELYVGIDTRAAHYIVPVQAKGRKDTIGVIQTIQDTVFCRTRERYKHCIVRPVSAQIMEDGSIAMFELHFDGDDVSIIQERRYKLVPSKSIEDRDYAVYTVTGRE